jgi:putative peptidoglycan lipid II flippase
MTQALGRFIIYATSPIVYNAGIVFGVVYLTPIWGIKGAIYGVLIGAVLHMAIQIPFLWKEGFLPNFSFIKNIRSTLSVFAISIPRTLTLATSHISILILLSFASVLTSGSITIFNFAFNLQSVLLSLIGVSYSLAVFPTLSRLYVESRMDMFVENIVTSLKHIVFWSVPGTVLFIVLRAQIVRTILGGGAFTWEATRLTAASLALFVMSVVLQNIVLLFIRAYYAIGKTITPLIINICSACFTVLSSFVFLGFFKQVSVFRFFIEDLLRVSDVPGTEILALALGFSFGSTLNCVLLWLVFRFDFGSFTRRVRRTLFEVFSASIIMGYVTYQALAFFVNIFDVETSIGIFLQGLCAGVAGIIVCVGVLYLLKSEELKEMREALSKRFFKASVVGPDAQVI